MEPISTPPKRPAMRMRYDSLLTPYDSIHNPAPIPPGPPLPPGVQKPHLTLTSKPTASNKPPHDLPDLHITTTLSLALATPLPPSPATSSSIPAAYREYLIKRYRHRTVCSERDNGEGCAVLTSLCLFSIFLVSVVLAVVFGIQARGCPTYMKGNRTGSEGEDLVEDVVGRLGMPAGWGGEGG